MAPRRALALAGAVFFACLTSSAEALITGPTPTSPPTVSGIAAAGDRLEAGSGTWTSSTPVTYAYQWYRCDAAGAHCSSVHGATAAGYMLAARDTGETIGLTVTATDGAGSSAAYASLVGPIAAARPLLVSTAQPQVTGLPLQGKALQVTAGGWSPAPQKVDYAWQRCNANGRICTAIAGATASSYTVASADVGHALVALVQASFGATKQSALSTATLAAIGGDIVGPVHTTAPAVTGIAAQLEQLTAAPGLWTGVGSLAYSYKWYRCDGGGAHCSPIRGATKTTYRLVPKDVGGTIGFTVHATDSSGTAAAYASLIGPIAPAHSALASSAVPGVTGAPRVGSTLTSSSGSWQPQPTTVTFAWLRCNANGRVCTPVEGAAAAAYTVTSADTGHALVAVVTATAGTTTQTAFSTATLPVA